jgi:hypothetical protein
MDAEIFKKEGVAILIGLVFFAVMGLLGYWYGLYQQENIITNEVYFEHVPAEPIPPLQGVTST